jgi:hypothetical protein
MTPKLLETALKNPQTSSGLIQALFGRGGHGNITATPEMLNVIAMNRENGAGLIELLLPQETKTDVLEEAIKIAALSSNSKVLELLLDQLKGKPISEDILKEIVADSGGKKRLDSTMENYHKTVAAGQLMESEIPDFKSEAQVGFVEILKLICRNGSVINADIIKEAAPRRDSQVMEFLLDLADIQIIKLQFNSHIISLSILKNSENENFRQFDLQHT